MRQQYIKNCENCHERITCDSLNRKYCFDCVMMKNKITNYKNYLKRKNERAKIIGRAKVKS